MDAWLVHVWRYVLSKGNWYSTHRMAEPDAVDVQAMLNEIGSVFGLACKLEVLVTPDNKKVVVKAGTYADIEHFEVVFQAMYSVPVASAKSIEGMLYSALWDIYQQADTGVAGSRPKPVYAPRVLRSRRRK